MRTEHLTELELARYAARKMEGAALLEASDHLANCATCRRGLPRPQRAISPNERSVSYDELVAWSDDRLDPLTRHEVEEKLRSSPQARAELDDLVAFRAEMNALPARDHGREAAADAGSSRRSLRGMLALAAIVSVAVGSLWWSVTLRQIDVPATTLRDGGQTITVAANGSSNAFERFTPTMQARFAEAMRTGKLPLPEKVQALGGDRGVLAGSAEEASALRVFAPVATAVREDRPQFRWDGVGEASSYKINVIEQNSGELIITQEIVANLTTWTAPTALRRGETYEWEVQAMRDGNVLAKSPMPPEPPARFRILSEVEVADFEKANRAAGDSHLARGLAAADAGLIDEARREFDLLAGANPDSPLVRQLLEQVSPVR